MLPFVVRIFQLLLVVVVQLPSILRMSDYLLRNSSESASVFETRKQRLQTAEISSALRFLLFDQFVNRFPLSITVLLLGEELLIGFFVLSAKSPKSSSNAGAAAGGSAATSAAPAGGAPSKSANKFCSRAKKSATGSDIICSFYFVLESENE
ncbi:hypothetical protein GCK72_019397 [Caenorhabditis remanei]|uniref:Uncharacterized protein n=1 Tax=Caenorhabditis remanei TaxID=31234 RepID=A0A6A5GED1_CAERE|nr:hypothetical protein GCK72_019397 [Caenorhabditis remanei]KAF1752842.1 hypothetical protein GCK72_019397 [Caenorhabditis remanei]